MGLKFVKSLTLPILIVLIFSRSGFCQPSLAGSPISIDQLETQIKKSISLTETKHQLDQLKRESQINGNYVLLARSIRAGITLRDRLTEDSLYFQNSAILDTLIASERTDQRLKPLLLLLRAQRISEFNKRRLTFNYATYSTKKTGINYALLSGKERDSAANADLESALRLSTPLINKEHILWLSSTPDIFLFTPALPDIVYSEKINLLGPLGINNIKPEKSLPDLFALPPLDFLHTLVRSDSVSKNNNAILRSYRRWIAFHKAEPHISFFIESLLRKQIYLSSERDSVTKRRYVDYLQQSIQSPYTELKAHAVYQLCLSWYEEGKKYASSANRYIYPPRPNFQAQYQYYPAQARELYIRHRSFMSAYPPLSKVLFLMDSLTTLKSVQVEMDNISPPGKEIPIKLRYKNVDTLYYRLTPAGLTRPKKTKSEHDAELLALPVLEQGAFSLPLPPDNNEHAVYLKLPAMHQGKYRLLFSGAPFGSQKASLNALSFQVSGIAAVNSGDEVFVLDRQSGSPVANAEIRAFKKKAPVLKGILKKTSSTGRITIRKQLADSISIIYKNDTLGYTPSLSYDGSEDEIYSKEEYDDLNEFFDEHLRMEIFCDRGIYRPGQSVDYKIIFMTNDPSSGKSIIFNRKNLGGGIFSNRVKQWLENGNNTIVLKDPSGRKIDSAILSINDFGSFSGSFKIPFKALTGEWRIDGHAEVSYYNSGSFRVEEYKRPTMEVQMEKPKKILRAGKPFSVAIKLRSLSGAQINNTPVKYTVSRAGYYPSYYQMNEHLPYNTRVELLHHTGYTDKDGILKIPVNDSALVNAELSDSIVSTFSYYIDATITDATGESVELHESLTLSTKPVSIYIPVNEVYEKGSIPDLPVATTAQFEGPVDRDVQIKLYRIENKSRSFNRERSVDQWYYDKSSWNPWFPDKAELPTAKEKKYLVLDTVVSTSTGDKFRLKEKHLAGGCYRLIATVQEGQQTEGQLISDFLVYENKAATLPEEEVDYVPFYSLKNGETISWHISSPAEQYVIYHIRYAGEKKKQAIENVYQTAKEKAGVNQWRFVIPAGASGELVVTRLSVKANRLERREKRIKIDTPRPPMDIVVEQYRQIMPPASTETFTLSVKTKSEKVAAELLTTLYDAALDKLTAHAWQIPVSVTAGSYLGSSGSYSITNLLYGGNINGSASLPYFSEAYDSTLDQFLSGRLSGLSITEASGLNEVVVVGYGVQKISATAAGISIRGQNTLQGYSQPLVVLDGKVFERELSTLDPSGISEIMTLKGAEATAIYGQRGAEGVLIISTKGPIVLPSLEVAPVKVRKDFRETAFFYPQLRSDKDGYYRFSFRMPESATEWHWKILAHTSGGNFAYLDRKLQTRLNLMVQPNIPRLLYQGDQIRLQSRISNLDSAITSGKIACRIEDAITGENLTPLIAPAADKPFTLKGKSTGSASFLLRIPATQLNPIRVTISAAGSGAADAEEHIVPILSPKIFARKTEQLSLKEPSLATIKSPALPGGSSPCGVSISIEQSPQASLLYALPWLANYSYDCSEQIFNKLRAHVTALNLMRTDTSAQAAYRRAKNALSKEASPKLPLDEANQEGSPWLDLSNKTTKLQEDLTSTLDTTKAKNAIRKHLERLYQSQKTDGGLPWFEGEASNPYITAYVLAGLGQLRQQGWLSDDHQRLTHFVERLLQYTQNELATQTEWQQIYSLYAVSYWLNSYHPSTAQRITIDQILSKAWNEAGEKSLGAQSLLIINSFRYSGSNNELLKERGRKLLGSIRQRAIEDNLYGLRWKEISDSEVIDQSAEETMALIAEALETSGDYNDEPRKMIKWLLSTKQNEHWQSTKATAAAITMLKKENALPFSNTRSMSLIVENKLLEVSDDVMSGVPLAATPLTELPEMVSLKTKGGTLTGAITWYYLGRPSVSEATGGQIKIQKQLSKIDDQLQSHPLDSATWLKPGDHVRIRLVIEANSRLKYVHITDPRAAAFEPKENSSGYRQGKGFTYYQSVRDTGIDIFAETLPRGVSELTYDVVVEQEGTFTSGPTALECMYRPAITAYGNATKINVASK